MISHLENIFTLRNVHSFPIPKWSIVFAMLFFTVPAVYFVSSYQTEFPGNALNSFVQNERSEYARHPQILVTGSSLAMCGIFPDVMEKNTGIPSVNIALVACQPTGILKLLTLFEKETSAAELLILELNPERLGVNQSYQRLFENTYSDFFSFYTNGFSFPRDTIVSLIRKVKGVWKPKLLQVNEIHNLGTVDDQRNRLPRDKNLPTRDIVVSKPKTGTSKLYYNTEVGFTGKDDPKEFQAVRDILQLCRKRSVVVVVVVTPQWYGQLNLSERDLKVSPINEYIALLQELKSQPDCEVIVCDEFTCITNDATDEDYLFDYGHMTDKGAMLYTNWLVEKLFESPKSSAVLTRLHAN